jgi:polyferredoxin
MALPWLDLFRLEPGAGRIFYLGKAYPLGWPYSLGLIVPFLFLVWGLAFLSRSRGRLFCGWVCPYGNLVETFEGIRTVFGRGKNRKVAGWMRRSPLHRWSLRLGAALVMLGVPLLVGASMAAYLYPPGQLLQDLRSLPRQPVQTVLWTWMGMALLGSWAAGFLVRFHFCRMVCIYGMGQALAASSAPPAKVMRPRYLPGDLSACGSCRACVNACFLELDPRAPDLQFGVAAGCFNCGDCLDACDQVQGHRGRPALLTFRKPAPPPPARRRREEGLEAEGES